MKINLSFLKPSKVFNRRYFDQLKDYSFFAEVHYGGASSGKSHGVVQKVVFKALQSWKMPRKVLFTRKVGRSLRDSIFEDVKQCLSAWGLLEYCKINQTDMRISLPNGAEFLFKGMDDPEKIKSIKGLSDVVMEEATEFNLEDYTQLTLRLRDHRHQNRQIFLMFNPVSKLNWVHKHFFEGPHSQDVVIHHSTYRDNRFLDEQSKKVLEDLQSRNPAYYRIYALGEFATLDKLVFPTYEKRRLSRDQLNHLPSYFGLDFGYVNDPSAFIHLKVDEEAKTIYFLEEYVKKGMLNDEIAQALLDMGYSKEVITADSAEKKSIAEIKRKGIDRIRPALKGPDSIIQGIQLLSQYRFIVDDRCVKLIEELENYTWKKDKQSGEYLNAPIDSYNHVIDAARYAVEGLNRTSLQVKTFKGGI